jgi:hypothetical protein
MPTRMQSIINLTATLCDIDRSVENGACEISIGEKFLSPEYIGTHKPTIPTGASGFETIASPDSLAGALKRYPDNLTQSPSDNLCCRLTEPSCLIGSSCHALAKGPELKYLEW